MVAIDRRELSTECACCSHGAIVEAGASFAAVAREVCFVSCVTCLRRAIVEV